MRITRNSNRAFGSAMVFAAVAAAAGAGGCSSSSSTTTPLTVYAFRGQYLVQTVLACGDCHTTPTANGLPSFDPSDFLAGGRELDAVVNGVTQKFYASNLTSDTTHGIGGWTDDQIKQAITQGIDDQGNALSSLMPYSTYGNMSADDLSSIVLYLRSLSASANQVPANSAKVSAPAAVIDPAAVPHSALPSSDPDYAAAERGRYLAGLAGACIECHTAPGPSDAQPLDLAHAFAGGRNYNLGFEVVDSANLTPDETGLSGWSAADIVATVQYNKVKGTGRTLCPPMPGGPNRDGDMTPGDLSDIATYLTNLAPIVNGPFGCLGPGGGSDGGTQ